MTTPDLPSRTHGERMESAARTYERFVPGAEPDRVAASMARRYGPLGTFAAETVGDIAGVDAAMVIELAVAKRHEGLHGCPPLRLDPPLTVEPNLQPVAQVGLGGCCGVVNRRSRMGR